MKNKNRIVAALTFCGAMSFNVASAVTVNFEDVPAETSGSFSSGGFNFTMTGTAAFVWGAQNYCYPSCPYNGTHMALVPLSVMGGSLQMVKSGGGSFSLSGFDGWGSYNFNEWGSSYSSNIPNQIDVIGALVGGGTVTQSFLIDKSVMSGPAPLTSYTFNSSFTNLLSVTFTSSGSANYSHNGFTVDNIVADESVKSPVPESETYAMLLAGLGLLSFTAKRRKQNA